MLSSAAEAETGALFHNCKTLMKIKQILNALGHKQNMTNIKTDNSTALAYCNDTLKPKRSKTWDMRWYWLKDRVQQNQFHIYWDKGINKYADYHSKHFTPTYHKTIRPTYILKGYHTPLVYRHARVCLYPPKLGQSKPNTSLSNHQLKASM